MSATVRLRVNAATLMRPAQRGSNVHRQPRGVGLSFLAGRPGERFRRTDPGLRVARARRKRRRPALSRAHRPASWTAKPKAAISRAAASAPVRLVDEPPCAGGFGKGHALADARRQHRRLLVGERRGGVTGDHRARGAAIEDEARAQLGAEDPSLVEQAQHLGPTPIRPAAKAGRG